MSIHNIHKAHGDELLQDHGHLPHDGSNAERRSLLGGLIRF